MRNRQTNEGVTGLDQSAAPSIRLQAVIATTNRFLRDTATPAAVAFAGRVRDTAAPTAVALAGRVRDTAAPAAAWSKGLINKVTDRFGMRMTVMGAATAIFIGATGSAAAAIPSMDTPPTEQTEAVVATTEAAEPEAPAEEAPAEEAPAEAVAETPAPKPDPKPVGGLNEAQMDNAVAIIEAGKDEGLDQKAWAIALATAMQESKFKNYANSNVAESFEYDYQAEGSDHDSVGLFQQRPSSGWGSVEELMDPKTSASKFYNSLEKVDDWEGMPVTVAAQTVQVSAFPDAYAQWEDLAWEIIDAYNAA